MIREDFAQKIRWTWVIWLVSIMNPFMIAPQLLRIWQTGETAGLSITFFLILFFVQGGFSLHGFFTRDRFIMGSNAIAATMTLFTILSTLYFRQAGL